GMNNSTEMLPLDRGLAAQTDYIRRTLDLIEKDTGVRPQGWSSPSVYPNADTFPATAAAGLTYSLDGMDSDILSRLAAPSGARPLVRAHSLPRHAGRHGTVSATAEGSARPRAAMDRLCRRTGARGPNPSRSRGDDRRDRHPSIRRRDAGRRGRDAPRPRVAE